MTRKCHLPACLAAYIFRKVNIQPVDVFSLLSHEIRLRCVLMLLDRPELCVCDLTTAIGAPQPSVSRHLGQLRAAGLVADRRDGQWIHYRLDSDLPEWVMTVVKEAARAVIDTPPYRDDRDAVAEMAADDDTRRCR